METVHKTIGELLSETCRRYATREALVHTEAGTRSPYGLLQWEVERIARSLVHSGLQRGDRMALWAPNIPEWIPAFLAMAKVGVTAVPIDPDTDAEGLTFFLGQSECRGIIMAKGLEEEFIPMAMAARDRCPSLEHIIVIADNTYPETIPWAEWLAMGEDAEPSAVQAQEAATRPEDTLAIMYTSGTTGKPKGVMVDHRGVVNKSLASTQRQGITPEDRLALFFPLFHMFGNTCIAVAGLLRGAALVIPCRSFDPSAILRALHKEQCTAVYASPSMLAALLEHPEFQAKRWQTVRKGTLGGAPCPRDLMKRLVEEVGVSRLTVGYGITEASSWITMTHPDDPLPVRTTTIGSALPCNEVKVVDPATGAELAPGQEGEVCTRGFLMKGYYKMPAATAAAVDRDGWLHTGDLGILDAKGYLRLSGRLREVIVRDGLTIHPVELEEVIHQAPGVAEVHVFGFPYPGKGQEVAAWIRSKKGSTLSLVELAAHLRDVLGPEKSIRYFKIVDVFPMTRSGKVQKFKLAEMAVAEYLGKAGNHPQEDSGSKG